MFLIGYFVNFEMNKFIILVGLDYIVVGFVFIYIVIKIKSLEIIIGVYVVNNMFFVLFFIMDDFVFGFILSLFKVVDIELGVNFIWLIVMFSVFYILCRGKIKKEEVVDKDQFIV